jgi:hypothetical protein
MKIAAGSGFFGRCAERSGYELRSDERDDKQEGRHYVEQRFRALIEKIGERSLDFAGREPREADDDARTADGEKHYADSNQDLTRHRETPKRNAACGTSRIDISVPVKDYEPVGEGRK